MGTIREEIMALPRILHGGRKRFVYVRRDDVLSILDESLQDPEGWELVADGTLHYHPVKIGDKLSNRPDLGLPLLHGEDFKTFLGVLLAERNVKPGDHIAIYRKRPQGDSKEKEE